MLHTIKRAHNQALEPIAYAPRNDYVKKCKGQDTSSESNMKLLDIRSYCGTI